MLKSKEGKASNSIILERRILKSLYGHWVLVMLNRIVKTQRIGKGI